MPPFNIPISEPESLFPASASAITLGRRLGKNRIAGLEALEMDEGTVHPPYIAVANAQEPVQRLA